MSTFSLQPGESVKITFEFVNFFEVDIDLLDSGTYENTIEGRIAKRIAYRNSFYDNRPLDFTNNGNDERRLDITGSVKFVNPNGNPAEYPWRVIFQTHDEFIEGKGRRLTFESPPIPARISNIEAYVYINF